MSPKNLPSSDRHAKGIPIVYDHTKSEKNRYLYCARYAVVFAGVGSRESGTQNPPAHASTMGNPLFWEPDEKTAGGAGCRHWLFARAQPTRRDPVSRFYFHSRHG